jgi:hypothetical protein
VSTVTVFSTVINVGAAPSPAASAKFTVVVSAAAASLITPETVSAAALVKVTT